jgi:hypothetical protein
VSQTTAESNHRQKAATTTTKELREWGKDRSKRGSNKQSLPVIYQFQSEDVTCLSDDGKTLSLEDQNMK